ncbi:hypothetical protein BWQ96_07109 [Gracilariopsis chorda]|uniref:Uncharacterized protein n=1 Tax=Gracilariopsis chorda TaxID=448386 RepID=A0A2V3IM61_9FLOR|nr:hypothetical protein BWQ96_07109 [Gracilariopsis chorda]|eukprot:PXF43165.1 hypothetical protein BWQ96_07109 [Gracilariopsis chorda]
MYIARASKERNILGLCVKMKKAPVVWLVAIFLCFAFAVPFPGPKEKPESVAESSLIAVEAALHVDVAKAARIWEYDGDYKDPL